jgi:protein phosphatase
MSATTDPRPAGGTFFTSHASSDRGRTRPGNEDNFYRGTTVFAVADGMGGHNAGEIASETAVGPLAALDGHAWDSAAEAERALADAVRSANTDVVEQAAANPDYRGMGTTLTAVLIRDGRLHVAHVGDSRAYLYRPAEGMSQLTTDHTLVEQLVREGRLSRDEIATHPQRSVITRAIGVESDVEVDTLPPLQLEPDDQILLCSDGLSGPVGDEEIARILAQTPDGDEACDALVRAANRAGGPDNITVVLLRVHGHPPQGAGLHGRAAHAGEEVREDTEEMGAVSESDGRAAGPGAAGPVHRISTRSESGRDFDARTLGRYGPSSDLPAEPEPPPGRLLRRLAFGTFGVVVVLGLAVAGTYIVLSRSWFVGIDDGRVAIFRGIPEEVAGIPLYRVAQRTGLDVADLPAIRVRPLEDGITATDRAAAEERVADLRQSIEDEAEEPAVPSPEPTIVEDDPVDPVERVDPDQRAEPDGPRSQSPPT